MQELFSHRLSDVSDGSFSNVILEMDIDATEGKCLLLLFCILFEGIVSKSAIVTMVVLNRDTVFGRKKFNAALGIDSVQSGDLLHEMNVFQAREVVNKYCSISVALESKPTLDLGNKTQLGGL